MQSPTTPQREPKQPPGAAKYSTAGCSAREVWEHSKREVKHSRLPKSQTWTLEMQTPASLKSGPHPSRKVGNADRNHSGCSTLLSTCRKAHESDFYIVSGFGNQGIFDESAHKMFTTVLRELKITKLQRNIHRTFWVSFCYRKLSLNLQYSLLKLLIIFQIVHNQNRLPVLKLDEQALYVPPFAVCLHSTTTRSTKTHQKSHC